MCSRVGARTVPSTPGLISNRICCITAGLFEKSHAFGVFAVVLAAGYGGFDRFTARRQTLVMQFHGRFADCGLLPVAWSPLEADDFLSVSQARLLSSWSRRAWVFGPPRLFLSSLSVSGDRRCDDIST